MKAFARSLIVGVLLLAALLGFHPGGVAADDGYLQALADPYPMNIDAAHRATTAPIFRAEERIAMWMNLPDGAASRFITGSTGAIFAFSDGSLNVVIGDDDWNNLALSATSIVAYGTASKVAAVYKFPPQPNLDLSLHIDANHHATTAPLYTRAERVVFWYNRADGSAADFMTGADDVIYTKYDGTLDFTITDKNWATLPADTTSIIAHGLFSNVTAVYVFPPK
jgi:hypothetical protein